MTPTTPSSMEGLIAVSGDRKDLTGVIGFLTWFSIPDESVKLGRLRSKLGIHGLPTSLAPKDTKAINTFKRAMREQDGRHRENGRIRENVVKPVLENATECVYQISSTVRDLEERVIDFPKALRVIFDKRTDTMRFNPLGGVKRAEALDVYNAIQDFYEANTKSVTGAKVRGIVRNYLKDQPDDERDIHGLSGENNTRREIQDAIVTTKALLSDDRERAVRSDVAAHHWANFRQLQRRSKEYANLLQDEEEEIGSMSRILEKQLDKLLG
jgi:Mg2+ and Co2+ transporter CorA